MDAEKRHQLKTNELAEMLGKLRDFGGDTKTRIWLIVLVVLIVAAVGYRAWGHMRSQRLTDSWMEWSQVGGGQQSNPAQVISDLQGLINNTSDRTLVASGHIRMAKALRRQAAQNPGNQEARLNESITLLKEVISDPKIPAVLVAAATYSLGTSHESLRHFDQATQAYQSLIDNDRFAGIEFTKFAADRLETMAELPTAPPFEPGLPPAPQSTTPPAAIPPAPAPEPTTPPAEAEKPPEQAVPETSSPETP